MAELTKFEQMLNQLRISDELRERGFQRAQMLLTEASVDSLTDEAEALRALGQAAERQWSGNFDITVEPLGFTLLERVTDTSRADWTATGTTKCTWDPWDGCSPDADF